MILECSSQHFEVQALLLARDPVALAATLGFGPHAALLGIVSAWDGVLGAERELQLCARQSLTQLISTGFSRAEIYLDDFRCI